MIYNWVPPVESVIEYAVLKSNPTIQYGYGNQYELLNYITVGKSKEQQNSIIDEENPNEFVQYPLVWFVPSRVYSLGEPEKFRVPNAKIIIAINNPHLDWLNPEREINSFSKLYPLVNSLLDFFHKNRYVTFENQLNPVYSFEKAPNYSHVDGKNKTIDVWDAIVIEANLKFDINCLKLKQNEKNCE